MELTVFITRHLPITFNCNRIFTIQGGDIELVSLFTPKDMKRYAKQLQKMNIMFLNQIIASDQSLLDWKLIRELYCQRPTKQMNWYKEIRSLVTINNSLTLLPSYFTFRPRVSVNTSLRIAPDHRPFISLWHPTHPLIVFGRYAQKKTDN